jgi:hypothetical protein
MWALAGWFLLVGGFSVVVGGLGIATEGINTNVLSLVVGLAMLWWGVGLAGAPSSGLRVHRSGITVHEPLRKSRQWTWSEVDHFELGRPCPKSALRVHLADGEVVNALGLEWRRARNKHLAEVWVDELNARVASAQNPASEH